MSKSLPRGNNSVAHAWETSRLDNINNKKWVLPFKESKLPLLLIKFHKMYISLGMFKLKPLYGACASSEILPPAALQTFKFVYLADTCIQLNWPGETYSRTNIGSLSVPGCKRSHWSVVQSYNCWSTAEQKNAQSRHA